MPRGVPKNGFRRKRSDAGVARKGANAGKKVDPGLAVVTNAKNARYLPHDPNETEEAASRRIKERFAVMSWMTKSTAVGENSAFIVSGPPGLGKSFGIIKNLNSLAEAGKIKFTVVRGFVRPTGLYKILYEHSDSKSVVVFDDADSAFMDDASLNMLKAACDTTGTRRLSWLTETRMEDEGGERLPRSFDFNGSVIFITNYDFDTMIDRGSRLAPHFEALISRAHYLDLSLKSKRDYLLRIKDVVENGGMLKTLGLGPSDEHIIMRYIEKNTDSLRELSLRMVIKLAKLYKIDKKNWELIARSTCLRNN